MSNFYQEVQLMKMFKEKLEKTSVTLTASGWAGVEPPFVQTVEVKGVTPNNIVVIGANPVYDNMENVASYQVLAVEQAVDIITFKAYYEMPDEDIVMDVLVGGEG